MLNVLCWLEVHMCKYFLDLQRGRGNPAVPRFHELASIITQRSYNLLPATHSTTIPSDGTT